MTEENCRDAFGRMTFSDIAMASGSKVLIRTGSGVNMPNRGLERMKRVKPVTKKWNDANET